MFWRVSGLAATSPVDLILDKSSFTLEELLDEDDLIQECKSLSHRLVQFLRGRPQVIQLVRYVVEEPPPDADDRRLFKYPFVSCEVFTCEIEQIFNTLLEDPEAMELLLSFLDPKKPHPNLLAGYFSKVVICLLVRRTPDMMAYLEAHQDILKKLVDLIGITSIMEVLLKLVGADAQILMYHADAVQWLGNTNLLDMLVDRLGSQYSADEHANAAETLCAVARTAPSALASQLSSPKYIDGLFQHVLEIPRSKTGVIHSLSVCITLLDPKRAANAAAANAARGIHHSLQAANPETLDGVLQRLGDLLSLLDLSGEETTLPTTYGELRPPLGIHRLKVVEFIGVLLRTNSDVARAELIGLGAIRVALDLFFRFPFNNMLHHHVESIVNSCLDSNSSSLIDHLLDECNLVDRLLQADNQPDAPDTRPEPRAETIRSPSRCGYMGHVTRMSNKLLQMASSSSQVDAHLQENKKWAQWQASVLQKRNQLENVYHWTCGRPASVDERPGDSDEEDVRNGPDFDISTISLASNLPREFHRYGMLDADEVDAEYEGAERAMGGLRVSEDNDSDEEDSETSKPMSTSAPVAPVQGESSTVVTKPGSTGTEDGVTGGGGTWFPFHPSGKEAAANANSVGFLSEPMVLEFTDAPTSADSQGSSATLSDHVNTQRPSFSFSVMEHYLNPSGSIQQAAGTGGVQRPAEQPEVVPIDLFANAPRAFLDGSNKASNDAATLMGIKSSGTPVEGEDDDDDFDVRGSSTVYERERVPASTLSGNRPVVIFGEMAPSPADSATPSETGFFSGPHMDLSSNTLSSFDRVYGLDVKPVDLPSDWAQVEFVSQPDVFTRPSQGGTITVWPPVFPEKAVGSPSELCSEDFETVEVDSLTVVGRGTGESKEQRGASRESELNAEGSMAGPVEEHVLKERQTWEQPSGGETMHLNSLEADKYIDRLDSKMEETSIVVDSVECYSDNSVEKLRLADAAPCQVESGGISMEPAGTAKAMEKAFREGIVDEAAPMKAKRVEERDHNERVSVSSDVGAEVDSSYNDVNFWKTPYDDVKVDDRSESDQQSRVDLGMNKGGEHNYTVKVGGPAKEKWDGE